MGNDTTLSIDLHGTRALVTGGTRGIGQAIAARLAQAGATVLTTARSAPDLAGPRSARPRTGRPRAVFRAGAPGPAAGSAGFIAADVSTLEGAGTIARAVQDRLGGVDVLVHNVGASFSRPGGALALTDEDWLLALNTNLMSAVRLDRLLLPAMVARSSGVILHTSSVQWRRPSASSPAYAAAKAALTNYSKELATEFGPEGVRVNTIVPGYIETSGALARIDSIAGDRGLSTEAAARPDQRPRRHPARPSRPARGGGEPGLLPGLPARLLPQRHPGLRRRRQPPGHLTAEPSAPSAGP